MVAATPCKRTVLIVDDDDGVASFLHYAFTKNGYATCRAADGVQALQRLQVSVPDLIVLDINMPVMDGLVTCRLIKEDPRYRLLPVLMLTGRDISQSRLEAWDCGADEYLTKPFSSGDVLARCRNLLHVRELIEERDSAQNVVFALARTIEAKSRFTHGHTERVTEYALAIARQCKLNGDDQLALRRGAALHDLGKIAVPDDILNKPAVLTPEEYAIVKTHPLAGVHIVEPLRSVRDAIPMIRWHHERMDGGGYPDGLFGANIPLLARIIAVADVFDALSSERPYRPAIPVPDCLDMIKDNAEGGGLDPEMVQLLGAAAKLKPRFAPLTPNTGLQLDADRATSLISLSPIGGK